MIALKMPLALLRPGADRRLPVPARRWMALAVLLCSAALAAPAAAQSDAYPTKPVRMIVPFGAGGTADLVARVLADKLGQELKQPFVIENRPGAGGTIGTEVLAHAPADGYTVGLGSVSTHATSISLYPKLPYDPRKDFTPIARVAAIPNVMVITQKIDAKNVDDFIALAKKSPGKLNFGSIGNATSQHLGGELFKMRTGVDMVHVPYRNNGLLTADLVSGTLQVVFDNLPNVIGQVKAGNLRALGITTKTRWPGLPEVPTLEEQGVKDFDISSWLGLFAPAGLPPSMVQTLNRATVKAMSDPEVRATLIKAGAEPLSGTPQELEAYVDSEIERWAKVVKASNAKID
ncbi:MAG: tripartite tricarboxylate transporter substrate binding protein [Variovorax sp.]